MCWKIFFLFSLVKLLNGGICISGIRPTSGGVNLPKWTSSRFWSISAVYTVYTVYTGDWEYSTLQYTTLPEWDKKKLISKYVDHKRSQKITKNHDLSQRITKKKNDSL